MEKQEDSIMRFKRRYVRGAKVNTNYGKQKRDEEKNKFLKCFKESFLTGTNTNKKSFSFNITFFPNIRKSKSHKIHLTLRKKLKEITSDLLGFSPKPTKMSAIQLEEMNKPLTIVFHSPLVQEIISENLSYQEF